MPNPNAVKASDVNTEMGVGSTTTLRWGNNWVRNVATQYTATNSPVNASKLRWGINFPGGYDTVYGRTKQYYGNSNLDGTVQGAINYDGMTYATGGAYVSMCSNGVMQVVLTTQYTQDFINNTWLTSGVNSDYTAQFSLDSGYGYGGSSFNTDHGLGTTVTWYVSATVGPYPGDNSSFMFGNLIIKAAGTEIFRRPINYVAQATVY